MRPWPGGLAARLVVLLVSALAIVQGGVVLVLNDEQRAVVGTMAHGQALNQAVTLARLVTSYPRAEADRLAAAFGSRTTCARVTDEAPAAPDDPLSAAERHLSEQLRRMLHGDYAGTPTVTLERTTDGVDACRTPPTAGVPNYGDGSGPPSRRTETYSAAMTVPLRDGRTLVYTAFVETRSLPTWIAAISFLISAIAVGVVVVVSVRHQTRGLGDLASAAERLGRGEEIAPLAARGPTEIALAISAFDTMRDRLRRHMDERLKLLAAVSHDLRTPLTTLRLKAEFVDDDAVREDLVATIDELTAITESTLAFSRAEASHEASEAIDLVELVGEVCGEFRLHDAPVEVAPHPPITFVGRPIALRRALRNVVDNAIRYGGNARVSFAVDAAGTTVRVEDDGPGIPESRLAEAFEPFVRLEPSRSRETGGTGLGLSITRGIVQAHGGTIRLFDRAGGGLTVEMTLPRASQGAGPG